MNTKHTLGDGLANLIPGPLVVSMPTKIYGVRLTSRSVVQHNRAALAASASVWRGLDWCATVWADTRPFEPERPTWILYSVSLVPSTLSGCLSPHRLGKALRRELCDV